MIEEALRDPISVGQLKINGEFMMKDLGIKPGPRMGWMLNALLEEVLDDPSKNTTEHLSELVKSLNMLGDPELKTLGERGKEKKNEQYSALISEIIKKQAVILGPEIAILKARSVQGLMVDNDGKVTGVGDNPKETLQNLVDQYVELSGLIVKNALGSIFAKYPELQINK